MCLICLELFGVAMIWWFCCLIEIVDLFYAFWFLPKNWSHVLASPFGRGGAPKA